MGFPLTLGLSQLRGGPDVLVPFSCAGRVCSGVGDAGDPFSAVGLGRRALLSGSFNEKRLYVQMGL